MFNKKSILNIFSKFTGKHLCQSLFFNKVADLLKNNKDTLEQVFSSEFWKNFKNTFLTERFRVTGSGISTTFMISALHIIIHDFTKCKSVSFFNYFLCWRHEVSYTKCLQKLFLCYILIVEEWVKIARFHSWNLRFCWLFCQFRRPSLLDKE